MNKLKKIIVPTDFSFASRDAFLFALDIATKLKAAVKVVHIYSGSFSTERPLVIKAGMGRHESLEDDLKTFVTLEEEEGLGGGSEVKVSYKAIGGTTTKELLKLSKKGDTLMLVMGMTGAGVSKERLFGTVSRAISQKADCPVLLIPKNLQFTGFRNVLYASNFDSVEAKLLRRAVDFAKPFKSTLHFIHVEEKEEAANIELEDRLFDYLFAEGDPKFAFNMATIDATSVTKGLNQYIEENKIDLTIMVTHHRSFWERILHTSMTKKMAIHAKVPILIFHEEDKS